MASCPASRPCPSHVPPCVYAVRALFVGVYTPVSMRYTQLGPGNLLNAGRPQLTMQLLPALHLLL